MSEKTKKFGQRVTVSVTAGDYDTLSAIAGRDDVSVSWVVRRAIDEYLRHRCEPHLMPRKSGIKEQSPMSDLA